MADYQEKEEEGDKKEESDEEILKDSRKALVQCIDDEEEERTKMLDDLRFCTLDQWPSDIRKAREGDIENGPRPCLTIDKINQYIVQVVNDMRQGKPGINVRPQDDKADVETAKVLKGIIRNIEDQSNADIAYATAGENAAKIGLGYVRVVAEYVDDESFDQELRIKPIPNTFSVYLSRHTMPDGSDAERGYILEAMPKSKFKEENPDAKTEKADFEGVDSDMLGHFLTDETITVVEEYCLYPVKQKLHFLADGTTMSEEDYAKWPKEMGSPPAIQDTRTTSKKQLKYRKMTGVEILDKRDLPGSFIPIAEEVGRETWVDGKRVLWGLVRPAKDSLRMYNYWASTITEKMGLAPKNPFVGAKGQFENLEKQWKEANTKNRAYLEYNAIDVNGNAVAAPRREGATPMEAAYFHFMQVIEHDVQTSLGMFKAATGESESQQSGRAILALQKESDTGTYHFGANQGIMIRHVGRIILDLIPHYYDTKRIVRIIGDDGETRSVQLDPSQDASMREMQDPLTGAIKQIHNPTLAKYDISLTVGPSYNTKRMEAAATYVEMAKGAADPASAAILRYLVMKNSDSAGAEEGAKILKSMLPPQALQAMDSNEPIPPKVMAEMQQMRGKMQQMQEAGAKMQQENMQLKAGAQTEMMKIKAKAMADKANFELERQKTSLELQMEREKSSQQLQMEREKNAQELALERQKLAAELEFERVKLEETLKIDRFKVAGNMEMEQGKSNAMIAIKKQEARLNAPEATASAIENADESAAEAKAAMEEMRKMQAQFLKTIEELVANANARKSISMTLPDGRTASATVTMQ